MTTLWEMNKLNVGVSAAILAFQEKEKQDGDKEQGTGQVEPTGQESDGADVVSGEALSEVPYPGNESTWHYDLLKGYEPINPEKSLRWQSSNPNQSNISKQEKADASGQTPTESKQGQHAGAAEDVEPDSARRRTEEDCLRDPDGGEG